MNSELRSKLADLLRETGRAHHDAFLATDGADPDWPIWYAGYLQDPLNALLEVDYTKSKLVHCLMDVDDEHQARSPEASWPEFYADQFLDRCAPSENPAEDTLALYHFRSCPFCRMVRSSIERLGLDVELRDILENPDYLDELIEARGRATVPVLRITSPDGEEHWMPESRDIVQYLEKTFA